MSSLFSYTSGQHPGNDTAPALRTLGLAVAPRGVPRPILDNLDIVITPGCHAALVGANGTGKSTLLRTLAGLIPPLNGKILINGAPATCGTPRVAYLAQRHLIEWSFPVTVRQAVLAGRYPHLGWLHRPGKNDTAKAGQAMRQLGLEPLANRPLDALSGGQQQRVLIARALCQEATLLLLDEPFTGLDDASREILDTFFANDTASGLTLLMATHERADAEKRFDLILEIRNRGIEVLHPCSCPHGHLTPARLQSA